MSARLTPVAIAELLEKTSTASVLISSQVSRAANEAIELLKTRSEVRMHPIPTVVNALSYESFLFPDDALRNTNTPSKYTAWLRQDVDALIMHSSGTTGLPKPIPQNQTYPLIYGAAHRLPHQGTPFRFNVSTIPLYHVSI